MNLVIVAIGLTSSRRAWRAAQGAITLRPRARMRSPSDRMKRLGLLS
jgi:hypothetical protein